MRSLTISISRSLAVPALAICLVAGTAQVPAQNTNASPVSQNDEQAQERAKELLKRAQAELKAERFNSARELAAQARATDPSLDAVEKVLRDIDQAEQKAAERQRAQEVQNLLRAADTHRRDQRYDVALRMVQQALELDPDNSRAVSSKERIEREQARARERQLEDTVKQHISAAEQAVRNNDFAGARASAQQARQTAEGHFQRDLERLDERIQSAEADHTARQRQERVRALTAQADEYRGAGRYEAARQTIAQALELDPEDRRAQRLSERIDRDRQRAAERAVQDQVDRHIRAARAAITASRFDEARRQEAEARNAAQGQFERDLDRLKDDIDQAESRHIQRQNREQIERLLAAAREQSDNAQFDRARQSVNQVLQIDRNNRDAARMQTRIAQAEEDYLREREQRQLAANLAQADDLLQAGNYDGAAAAYERILRENPDNRDARRGAAAARIQVSRAAQPVEEPAPVVVAEVPRPAPVEVAQVDEDAEARRAEQEAEAQRQREEQERARREAEETRRAQEEAAAQRRAEQEAEVQRQREEQEQARREAEETRRVEREAEAQRRAEQEAEAQRQREERDRARREAEEARQAEREAEAQRRQEEAERQRAEEEERRRQEAEAREAERLRAEEEARQQELQRARRNEAVRAYREGVQHYRDGNLPRARQRWLDAKELDPAYTEPDVYLEQTEAEYNAYLAKRAEQDDFERREAQALERMNTLIGMTTREPMVLSEFLVTLRVFSGIDFVIAGQVDARVEAAFDDEPLHKVLDSVLTPIGLRWERKPGSSTVVITPDLRTEVFPVLPNILNTVDMLIEQGIIPRLLWGPQGEPVLQGQEIMTDSRSNVVIVTDSEKNLEKFRRFLEGLRGTEAAQLVFASFEIDERRAPQIKALLDAYLRADDDAPYSAERKLILEGSTLIIKDTPENVQRVESLLLDEGFMSKFYERELDVRTWNLTPVISFENNPDLQRAFADQVRQAIETMLYAREGRSRSEAEGRRLFYDAATMQLTLVDYPDRLEAVDGYIRALPQIRHRRESKIIFLDWATASDMVDQIEQFLGVSVAGPGIDPSVAEITQSLRVEQEVEFRGATFRVLRVNENTIGDDFDNDVQIFVRTGVTTQEVTIQQFRSEFVDDFEIIAEDVRPSAQPGRGRARLRIRYSPGGQIGGDPFGPQPGVPAVPEEPTDVPDTGLNIVDIENLNAIFVQYDNIEDLREVEFWVKTLDIPTLQVSIEVKFVEVIQNKAQQLKSSFTIGDLTESLTLSESVLRNRFAQDRDEYMSPFDPPYRSEGSGGLLKGMTVFDFIVNNGASPISMELRMLEASGLINIVNGPTVTVLNRESADFEIVRQLGLQRPVEGAAGTADQTQFQAVASITPVSLSVSPTVTRAGNITLDIDVEMNDFEKRLAQLDVLTPPENAFSQVGPRAFFPTGEFGVLRKELTTQARIRDGGTVVLGGWRSERTDEAESGVPILRDIPYIGRILFNRFQREEEKVTLLIFLTGHVVRD